MVDFNPYSPMTDALLFTWDELSHIVARRWEGGSEGVPVVRIVEGEGSIQPSDLQSFRLPKVSSLDLIIGLPSNFFFPKLQDVVDLSTGEDIHKFVDPFKNVSISQPCSRFHPLFTVKHDKNLSGGLGMRLGQTLTHMKINQDAMWNYY